MRLRDRFGPAALVTGASDGIGRAFAEALAAEGFDLVLAARRADRLEALARALSARHGIAADVVAADLGTDAGVAALVAATDRREIGLLVAAAGYETSGPLVDAGIGSELDMLSVNCRAVLALRGDQGLRADAGGRAARRAVPGRRRGARGRARADPQRLRRAARHYHRPRILGRIMAGMSRADVPEVRQPRLRKG